MKILKSAIYGFAVGTLAAVLAACASIKAPEGGPRDETPPRLVRAQPAPGSINVDNTSIHLDFDEYITLKDAFTNVVVSPTSETQPRVSGVGRRVNIEFTDTLQPNTTYTIDFGDAIQDNNEGNALQGFTYTFSTGPVLDSLRISGMVLDSHTLEPQQGMLVGIHTSEADTAFSRIRLERVARTDDRGRFTLRGLAPGKYRLFALNDLNGDMRWDNPEERIAFYDEWIVPTAEPAIVSDTIFNNKTLEVDSVRQIASTNYLPNDILLSSFSLGYRPQYLKKNERPDSTRAVLVWNATQAALPAIRLLDEPNRPLADWALTEIREGNDSVTLWLRDPQLIHNDTLRLTVNYIRNISRNELEAVTDTLNLVWRRPKIKPSKGSKVTVPMLDIKGGAQTQEYNLPFEVTFGTPIDTIFDDRLRLQQKVDTTWVTLTRQTPLLHRADTLNPLIYNLDGPWEYDAQYRLVIDSTAIVDLYGHHNKPAEFGFRVRKADDYASLTFMLTGLGGAPAFVELLDGSDKVVDTQPVVGSGATFTFLKPATYYARVIYDLNGNGLYDTGDYDTRIQPEAVAYYPKKITLRKNWDQQITWNVNEVAVDMQKPTAIKKNRPKTPKNSRKNNKQTETEEDEPFDPSVNPFDPNSRRNRNNNSGTY